MHSDVQLNRQSGDELHFAYKPFNGAVFAAIGTGVVWLSTLRQFPGLFVWGMRAFGGLFAAVGVGGMFWRQEFTINVATRRWTRRRGHWPLVRKEQGGFRDVSEVALEVEPHSGHKPSSLWLVRISFTAAPSITIAEARTAEAAEELLEAYSSLLGAREVDRSRSAAQAFSLHPAGAPLSE